MTLDQLLHLTENFLAPAEWGQGLFCSPRGFPRRSEEVTDVKIMQLLVNIYMRGDKDEWISLMLLLPSGRI